MMKLGTTLLLAFALALSPMSVNASKIVFPKTTHVVWEGSTDSDMLVKVRKDIKKALKNKVLVLDVEISSGGGPVLTSIEIARLVREAHDKYGLTVKINAVAVCASGCTIVLAAGTPGARSMDSLALFLIHPMQDGDGMVTPLSCIDMPKGELKTVNDKVTANLYSMLIESYMKYTGNSRELIESWLVCGSEQVGRGELALSMGFVDRVNP